MSGRDPFDPLVQAALASEQGRNGGVEIRELVAFADEGRTPLLVDVCDPAAVALRALSVVDLHEAHLGRRVVIAFEHGDPSRPIVMGVLPEAASGPGAACAALHLTADDERVVVTAKSRLVLRCGKASITLTSAGKVLIDGTCVHSRSSGLNRIKGGAVQIN
jgi:hypothetical protein